MCLTNRENYMCQLGMNNSFEDSYPKLPADFQKCFEQFLRFFPRNFTMTYADFLIYYSEILCLTDIDTFLADLAIKCIYMYDIDNVCFYPATIYLVHICRPNFKWKQVHADKTLLVANDYGVRSSHSEDLMNLMDMFILSLNFLKACGHLPKFELIYIVLKVDKLFNWMLNAHQNTLDDLSPCFILS